MKTLAALFLILSTPAHAQQVSIHMDAEARFIHTQILNGLGENIAIEVDVTAKVPHEVQVVENEKLLVIL